MLTCNVEGCTRGIHHHGPTCWVHEAPYPVEPVGTFIRDELQARGWTVGDLARLTGLTWTYWARHVLGERPDPITEAIAKRLGKATGTTPGLWLNLQRQTTEGTR